LDPIPVSVDLKVDVDVNMKIVKDRSNGRRDAKILIGDDLLLVATLTNKVSQGGFQGHKQGKSRVPLPSLMFCSLLGWLPAGCVQTVNSY
jgi:hypothetical protein